MDKFAVFSLLLETSANVLICFHQKCFSSFVSSYSFSFCDRNGSIILSLTSALIHELKVILVMLCFEKEQELHIDITACHIKSLVNLI